MSEDTKYCLVVADVHAGSTVALWPEGQPIQDGGLYEPNVAQRYLAGHWRTMLSEVAKLPHKPTLVLLGDLIQGGNPKDAQLVSRLPTIQAEAALQLLRPLASLCGTVYVVRGTEWHEGPISESVEILARELGAKRHPTTGAYTWPALYLTLGGNLIHFAHHVGVSAVPAYEATAPTRELTTMLGELVRNYPTDTPRLKMVVRAHRHRGIHVHLPPDLHAMVVPAWQLATAFSHRVAPGSVSHVGYGLIEVRDGRLVADVRTFGQPPLSCEVAE